MQLIFKNLVLKTSLLFHKPLFEVVYYKLAFFCRIPNITSTDTKGTNNGKGNVIICESFKVRPMCDVFSYPAELNKTVLLTFDSSDSEDNESFNSTVIQIDCD